MRVRACGWVGVHDPGQVAFMKKELRIKRTWRYFGREPKRLRKKSLLRSHLTMKYEGNETLVKGVDVVA